MGQTFEFRPGIVVEATREVQAWVDRLAALARTSGTVLGGHAHDDMPHVVVTLATVWRAVEDNFLDEHNLPWSIASRGLPPIPNLTDLRAAATDPNVGGGTHNALHRIFGNFHD